MPPIYKLKHINKMKKLVRIAKNNSWSNVNQMIENLGLQLELVQDLPFCKLWIVKNDIEIHSISNTIDYANNGNGDIKFTFNN